MGWVPEGIKREEQSDPGFYSVCINLQVTLLLVFYHHRSH
jgi:hypothetical protein